MGTASVAAARRSGRRGRAPASAGPASGIVKVTRVPWPRPPLSARMRPPWASTRGWFRAMITYSLYAVIAGAVLRVFSAVGIAFITSMGQADLNFTSLMDVGLWMLAVVPFFIAGILASLKIGELASMLVTGGGAGGSGLMGMVSTAGMAAAGGGTAAAGKVGAGGMK